MLHFSQETHKVLFRTHSAFDNILYFLNQLLVLCFFTALSNILIMLSMVCEKDKVKKVCKDPNAEVRETFIKQNKPPGLIFLCGLICIRVLSNDKINSIFMEEKYTQNKKAFALAEKIQDTTC